MTEIIAKPVLKNKFWIVEEAGEKIATILAIEEGGFAYVHDDRRELFPSISLLAKKYNIKFAKVEKLKKEKQDVYDVYGYPTNHVLVGGVSGCSILPNFIIEEWP